MSGSLPAAGLMQKSFALRKSPCCLHCRFCSSAASLLVEELIYKLKKAHGRASGGNCNIDGEIVVAFGLAVSYMASHHKARKLLKNHGRLITHWQRLTHRRTLPISSGQIFFVEASAR
jgi:hypothetical protein